MTERPDDPEIVPDPDVARAASALLRGVVRYIAEGGDEPDATPERLEAALGVMLVDAYGGGFAHVDDRDRHYDCAVHARLGTFDRPGLSARFEPSDAATSASRALVVSPDLAEVAATLRGVGFDGRREYGSHGGFPSMRFTRGAMEVVAHVQGESAASIDHDCVRALTVAWPGRS